MQRKLTRQSFEPDERRHHACPQRLRQRYQDGSETKVHFFASRLKYSRWVEVTVVSDEPVETPHARLGARPGLRHGRSLTDSGRQTGPREDAPGSRGRVPRDSERLRCLFHDGGALIDDLSAAFRASELANALPAYTHPAVLVVDEAGYLTYGTDTANMLFHVVNERHCRHRPVIFTTNKSLKAWGRVLHDEDLAQAIIDRVSSVGDSCGSTGLPCVLCTSTLTTR